MMMPPLEAQRPSPGVLQIFQVLAGVEPRELARLARQMAMFNLRAKCVIASPEKKGDAIYFMVSGFAKVGVGRDDDRIAVALIGPGESFGMPSALSAESRSSVATLTACTLLSIPVAEYLDAMRRTAAIAIATVHELAGRLARMQRQIELVRGPLGPRVQSLLDEWRSRGVPDTVRLSNAEIARMLGCSREAISRVMSEIGLPADHESSQQAIRAAAGSE